MSRWKIKGEKEGKVELFKCTSVIDGDVVPGLILGTTGELFHGREVVAFRQEVGLFGCKNGKEDRVRYLTLVNGLLNQCALSDPPTPYWAVIDAACQLKKGYKRKDVMDLAVKMVGEENRKGCEYGWDILRNHHRHERKRECGMAFMIESMGGGMLLTRARGKDETRSFFDGAAERKILAKQFKMEMKRSRKKERELVEEMG